MTYAHLQTNAMRRHCLSNAWDGVDVPMAAIAAAGGPTKTTLVASQAVAKPAFSLRKP